MANRRRLRENEFHKPRLTAGQFRNRDARAVTNDPQAWSLLSPSEFGKAEQSRSAFEARNTIGQSFPRSNFFARKNDQDLSVGVIDRSRLGSIDFGVVGPKRQGA
jgi:hypothetical protein